MAAQTVVGTVCAVFMSRIRSIMKIQDCTTEPDLIYPADQALMARRLLGVSFREFLLFLALMIYRLYTCIQELCLLKESHRE